MRAVLCAGLLLIAGSDANAASFVGAGQPGVFTGTYVGCREQADEDRFSQLASEGDKEAAVAFSDARWPACDRLTPGTQGFVEDISFLHATSCFRPKGRPECLWTPTEFIAKP